MVLKAAVYGVWWLSECVHVFDSMICHGKYFKHTYNYYVFMFYSQFTYTTCSNLFIWIILQPSVVCLRIWFFFLPPFAITIYLFSIHSHLFVGIRLNHELLSWPKHGCVLCCVGCVRARDGFRSSVSVVCVYDLFGGIGMKLRRLRHFYTPLLFVQSIRPLPKLLNSPVAGWLAWMSVCTLESNLDDTYSTKQCN